MNKFFCVVLTISLTILVVVCNSYRYYVRPDSETNHCPQAVVCEILDYYARNVSLFSNDFTLLFLHGHHKLTTDLVINNITMVTLMPVNRTSNFSGSVVIDCAGSAAGVLFNQVNTLSLLELTFVYCGTSKKASHFAVHLHNVIDVHMQWIQVRNSSGYGLLARNVLGNFLINNCKFEWNSGTVHYNGGNAYLHYDNCPPELSTLHPPVLNISSSYFCHGNYTGYDYDHYNSTLSTGLTVDLSCTNVNIHLSNLTMSYNLNSLAKGIGGNLFVHFYNPTNYTSNNVNISDCHFIGGHASLGGGIAVTFFTDGQTSDNCHNTFTLSRSEISGNSAVNGGGLYIEVVDVSSNDMCPMGNIEITDCTFQGNMVRISSTVYTYVGGTAIHILNGYIVDYLSMRKNWNISVHNTTITESKLYKNLSTTLLQLDTAAVYCLKYLGNLIISDSRICHNEMTAVALVQSKLSIHGEVTIANNTGTVGGGVLLYELSFLILHNHATIYFTGNHAHYYGGGIYVEQPYLSYPSCFYQFPVSNALCYHKISQCNNRSIVMRNNTAALAGDDIYGGSVALCSFHNVHVKSNETMFYTIFDVRRNNVAASDSSAVSSNAMSVCPCNMVGIYNCSRQVVEMHDVYPGQVITIMVVLAGQLDGAVPGTLTINDSNHQTVYIKGCTGVPITPMKTSKSTITERYQLQILNEAISTERSENETNYISKGRPLLVHVKFNHLDCPTGFELSETSSTCECATAIKDNSYLCNITDKSLIRRSKYISWIGFNDISDAMVTTGLLFYKICPLDYCKKVRVKMNVENNTFDSDRQCSLHRGGILCGSCQENFSISLGTGRCLDCRHVSAMRSIAVVLGGLLLGILVVAFLSLCDITTTDGTISGLLFYANVMNANYSLFYFDKKKPVLPVLLSWLNLDPGIGVCFYDGMDMYVSALLQFAFPIYMWSLVAFIILLSKRCYRVSKLLGSNAVKLLATVIELSYYGTLEACITALAFTGIRYPTHDGRGTVRYAWLYDANIDYLGRKHIALFLVGTVFSIFLLLFTVMLLCLQPLQRYSHVYCFRWVSRLKPLIDAYAGPNILKDKCRYWIGLLLFFRIILAVSFAIKFSHKPENNLLIILVVCIIIFAIALATGGVYEKVSLNVLNSSYLLNLAIVTAGSIYLWLEDNDFYGKKHSGVLVDTSMSIALLTAIAVLCYHMHRRCSTWRCCKQSRQSPQRQRLLSVHDNSIRHERQE